MYTQITKIEMVIAGLLISSLFWVDIIKIVGKIVSAILVSSF
ncbi:hypothetical protein D042_2923 [Vibrio parahaemolyticus NIHCB0757]|nr:hypothetical protein D042_2923 [Vibrio parahaemolyticus NIHCB0757]KIT49485.1 hypothetical protein H331_01685 [Vibrio parahaemolyticus 3644]